MAQHQEINVALLEALGIDPVGVSRATIELVPDNFPSVVVEKFVVERGSINFVQKVINKYRLAPSPEVPK